MAKSKKQKDRERERREKEKTEHWLLVHNPWVRDYSRRRANLTEPDLQDILCWLALLLRCRPEKINTIQHQANRTFIIVKVDLDADIHSRLGLYKWKDFLLRPSETEQDQATQVLEYDYVEHGDPSENQWKESYPELGRRPPFHLFTGKFPEPTWCDRPHAETGNWTLPLPKPLQPNDQQLDNQITGENMASSTSVRLLSQPPLYSRLPNNGALIQPEGNGPSSSSFQPYQSALQQNLSSTGYMQDHNHEQKERPVRQRTFITINNPYGVQWSDMKPPGFLGIWNWLQMIVDGPEELYADINRRRVIVSIKEHVELLGVLGRHLWCNFLRDCPSIFSNEVSLITRMKSEDDLQGLLKIDVPRIDEDYEAFVENYPHPDPFMSEFEEVKDVKSGIDSKNTKMKMEDEIRPGFKRENYPSDEENELESKKRVKLE